MKQNIGLAQPFDNDDNIKSAPKNLLSVPKKADATDPDLMKTPNLRRMMDGNERDQRLKRTSVLLENEQHLQVLEQTVGITPPRRGKKLSLPPLDLQDKIVTVDEGRKVSRETSLSDESWTGWYNFERRLQDEYEKVVETSFQFAFGKNEKKKVTGVGRKTEPVFTVAPYEDSRVVLSAVGHISAEDDPSYVNASHIAPFIAAAMPQGELARHEFWRMIWETGSDLVVMLNQDSEGKKRPGDIIPYVGKKLFKWYEYGPISVNKIEHNVMRHLGSIVRVFNLKYGAEEKTVTHIQFRDWPDGGVPSEKDDFVEFIDYLYQHAKKGGKQVIHCFGGKGRTGVVIALLLSLLQYDKDGTVDVCGVVSYMRTRRELMVETQEQYKCIYHILMRLLSQEKTQR